VLFLAREPLSSRKLSQFANLADATQARTRIRRLNELYDQTGRAFRVEEVAGGYQLLTRPRFATWLRRLEHVPRELRLSAPALETLAVVAYRQPTSRAEVEAIRGVNCGEILRQLMDRDLLRISGRGDELGRPYLYATTQRFLQLFGLKSLDKLPPVIEMQSAVPDEVGAANESKRGRESGTGSDRNEEENDVTATTVTEWSLEEVHTLVGQKGVAEPRCADDEDADDIDEFEDEDEDDDFDDDDDDDFDDEEDEEFDDDDFDDEEWEEVDDDTDEGDDWDEDEDEDEDWGDEEEDDGDDFE